MSWLSNVVGKIPVVGHGLNQVGKVLPSVGQMVGSAALGPIGNLIGASLDPNTTSLQKKIGGTVDAAAAALGGGSLLGGLGGGAAKTALGLGGAAGKVGTGSESDPYGDGMPGVNIDPSGGSSLPGWLQALEKGAGAVGGAASAIGGSKLLPLGLGAAGAINAANLQKQSTDYANKAYDTVNQSYATRAPLRVAGQAGMLNPVPSSNVTGLAQSIPGNPFTPRKPLGVA